MTPHLTDRSALLVASTLPEDMRRRNVSAVLRAVLAHGPVARSEISRLTGLSAGTVTKLTTPLLGAGLLHEQPPAGHARDTGRPRVPVELDLRDRAVVGLHLGLLRTTVGLVDLRAGVFAQRVVAHSVTEPEPLLREARDAVEDLARVDGAGRSVLGVGASVGGWVDHAAGTIVEHPSLGWRDVPARAELEALGRPLRLDNSVRAHALAETWFGTATGKRSVAYLFVGNIVGAALVIDRAIHHGPRSAAGHLTHFPVEGVRGPRCACGRHNCLQAVASDVGMLTLGRETGVVAEGETLESVIARARDRDRPAARLLRDRARRVGQAVAVLLDLVNPDLVVLAGGLVDAPEYLDDVRAEAARRTHVEVDLDRRVVTTALGEHALVASSAALVLDAYYDDPFSFEARLAGGRSAA